MVKLVLLAGLLVPIAILAALPRWAMSTRVPDPVVDRSESVSANPQHAYLHLHHDDDLIAKP